MTVPHPGAPARRRASAAVAALFLALVAVVTVPLIDPEGATAGAASHRPLAVVVVGPVEGLTSLYLRDARRITAQLRRYGAHVREVYSPRATWARVKAAARGANLFVYLGHGNGYPSPYGRFNPRKMDGLGLNRTSGRGNANVRYYGEHYVRRGLDLAPGAVVILNHVCYAAGGSEPGRAYPTRRTALRRADNFAAGFLGAGAAAVFASDRSVTSVVRDLFRSSRSMTGVFWRSPWTTASLSSTYGSRRTRGATVTLAPYGPGRYYQSLVARRGWTTTDWRHTWSPPAVKPTPSPAASATPEPSVEPAPTPSAPPTASPEPTPGPTPAPEATPVP